MVPLVLLPRTESRNPKISKERIFGITPLDELQRAIRLRERSSVINTRCCNEYNGIAVEKSICFRGSLHLRLLACFSREELLKITYYVFLLTLNIKYLSKKNEFGFWLHGKIKKFFIR